MLTSLVPLLIAVLVLMIGGPLYGPIRYPIDPRDRFVLRLVALVISASWLASGALALHALR